MLRSTPIETFQLNGHDILVKREDLCCPLPGPSFSKMRGVVAHIASRPEGTIGVLDTLHSKAGWGVAWACRELGKHCVNFWPYYKREVLAGGVTPLREAQRHSEELGSELVRLKAGRSAVLYHEAKKLLMGYHGGSENAYMMPNALKLRESVVENAAEVVRSRSALPAKGTVVISISSGTVAAGVIKGLHLLGFLTSYEVVLHMGYSRSVAATLSYVREQSGTDCDGVAVVDEGYDYADKARPGAPCPFPSNEHYDLKAWRWLQSREPRLLAAMKQPIVFWNIGD